MRTLLPQHFLFISTIMVSQLLSAITALSVPFVRQQQLQQKTSINRRDAVLSSITIAIGAVTSLSPDCANAAEDNQVLSDEEMAARVAKKMELLRSAKSRTGSTVSSTDVRSDINPDAAVNLRSRSALENAKIAMEKQKEMKSRDSKQKREDLCEMLGRGC